jgi:hypothetical protein
MVDEKAEHQSAKTESGELERPSPLLRKIDCGGLSEAAERRVACRGGLRVVQERTRRPA